MQRQAQRARGPIPQAEGSCRQESLAVCREPFPTPAALATKPASVTAPRIWRPRKDKDLREKEAVADNPKTTALEEADKGIINVYRGRDPPFSASGLSSLREFHKDRSAVDLYGLTPENREIVELALKNTKAEGLLITKGSDSAIKAVYQANREAKARGSPGYHPDQKALEDEAPFNRSDLQYLRHYFSVTSADVLFGLTTEEKARVKRLDDYLNARDALAEARRTLEAGNELSPSPKTEAAARRALPTKEPVVEGRGNPFFGHEPEDDLLLETSDGEYEEILRTIEAEGKTGGGIQ
ncbi:unnamed protein product, partial [Prunus brigantina]